MVSFDASAAALGYKAPALVMHGCIHLIRPPRPYFYSQSLKKWQTEGVLLGVHSIKTLDLIPHGIFRQAPE
jgi:hypothetical protein